MPEGWRGPGGAWGREGGGGAEGSLPAAQFVRTGKKPRLPAAVGRGREARRSR